MSRPFIRFISILFLFFHQGYGESRDTESYLRALAPIPAKVVEKPAVGAVGINPDKSLIRWKGTKLRRTGKHEATIPVKAGSPYIENDQIKARISVLYYPI